jgi:hypothetical protein
VRALLSVADGGGIGIATLARALQDLGVEVVAREATRTQRRASASRLERSSGRRPDRPHGRPARDLSSSVTLASSPAGTSGRPERWLTRLRRSTSSWSASARSRPRSAGASFPSTRRSR